MVIAEELVDRKRRDDAPRWQRGAWWRRRWIRGLARLTELASAHDPLDGRPNIAGNVGEDSVVEVSVGGQVSVEELLAWTGAAVTMRRGKLDL